MSERIVIGRTERPTRPRTVMPEATVTARVPYDLKEKLDDLAWSSRMSLSAVIRAALAAYVESPRPSGEISKSDPDHY